MVTNAVDMSVDNRICDRLVAHWRAQGTNVTTYLFPKELKLIHDCIDPQQPQQQIDTVYPVLIELIEAPPATARIAAVTSQKM
jgi:carboxylesterase